MSERVRRNGEGIREDGADERDTGGVGVAVEYYTSSLHWDTQRGI